MEDEDMRFVRDMVRNFTDAVSDDPSVSIAKDIATFLSREMEEVERIGGLSWVFKLGMMILMTICSDDEAMTCLKCLALSDNPADYQVSRLAQLIWIDIATTDRHSAVK